jgi:hypothetical protein
MRTGRPLAIVVMVVFVFMGVRMPVRMIMPVGMIFVIMALDPGFTFTAATYCTHLSSPRVL